MYKLLLVVMCMIWSEAAASDEWIQDEIDCLAKNIYFEARGESLTGKIAVANVTMNRVKHHKYPSTVCGVVTQAKWYVNWKGNRLPRRNQCQFSWFCDGKADVPNDMRAYKDSIRVAEVVYHGYRDLTDGSLFYHSTKVEPYWVASMVRTKSIGAHVFYRYNR